MKETSGEERRADRKMSSTVDRETFRKVVSQRQKMKAELRGLQERLAALPEDWEERLPHWLDLERSSLEPASDQIEPDPEPAGGPEMAVEDGEEPKNSEADAEEFNSQAESIPGSFAESREWEEKERGGVPPDDSGPELIGDDKGGGRRDGRLRSPGCGRSDAGLF